MVLLDKLMRRLRETGHRVLIFSQVWCDPHVLWQVDVVMSALDLGREDEFPMAVCLHKVPLCHMKLGGRATHITPCALRSAFSLLGVSLPADGAGAGRHQRLPAAEGLPTPAAGRLNARSSTACRCGVQPYHLTTASCMLSTDAPQYCIPMELRSAETVTCLWSADPACVAQ
jgi:hypothetical protein